MCGVCYLFIYQREYKGYSNSYKDRGLNRNQALHSIRVSGGKESCLLLPPTLSAFGIPPCRLWDPPFPLVVPFTSSDSLHSFGVSFACFLVVGFMEDVGLVLQVFCVFKSLGIWGSKALELRFFFGSTIQLGVLPNASAGCAAVFCHAFLHCCLLPWGAMVQPFDQWAT